MTVPVPSVMTSETIYCLSHMDPTIPAYLQRAQFWFGVVKFDIRENVHSYMSLCKVYTEFERYEQSQSHPGSVQAL